ncbi:hypothetical protein SAMN04487943_10288 [Gracilibacillus orientalis]|uniref:DUF2264 domain-containing protein n=1 Tax=Gracilibacillus orientalis TaxID=334253 RepID=A0A1I4IGK2_9BACI|nr:DUF2264 domain-containing protein [Gracilibacillus orientalis]SFL53133.1 hypothetical protein SAMN04487943_10288 [Gracilibacillus orientalis]
MKQNPLETKQDIEKLLTDMWEPLTPYYDETSSRIRVGQTAAAYSEDVAGLECFSRVLWGAAPLLASNGSTGLWSKHLQGIINGTDPQSKGYWGQIQDYDQRIVEMAAFGYTLCLAPEHVWEPLTEEQKENLVNWLSQINKHSAHDCNWLFFAVIVNIGLKKVDAPYDQATIERNLNRFEDFYLGDGWYKDGEIAHVDYYTPFALHYYGLFYAAMMEKDDPQRSKVYKDRATLFAKDFLHWFSEDGRALPYGRSLTYRFAQCSFWSAYVYAGLDDIPLRTIKGIILRHLRYWSKQDILLPDGTLSIGYQYPNLLMAENYNAPGSPYWAFKTFLILALSDEHPFWQVKEDSFPTLPSTSFQEKASFILERDQKSDHVVAFTPGYQHTNGHTHTSAKYEKFAYSNHFGFSVPRAEWGLDQGAYDCMLAVSEQDELYRVKRSVTEKAWIEDVIYFKWKPWHDVTIKTWIIPGVPWHVRIHQIDTARPLDIADGGFALGLANQDQHNKMTLTNAQTPYGSVVAQSLAGKGEGTHIFPNANTNIMTKRTVIPTIKARIEPGEHQFIHMFYGSPATDEEKAPVLENGVIYYRSKKWVVEELLQQ